MAIALPGSDHVVSAAGLPTSGASFTVCSWLRLDIDGNDYDGAWEFYGPSDYYYGPVTDSDGVSLRAAVAGNDSNMYAPLTVGVWCWVMLVYGPAGTVTWYYANEGGSLVTANNSGVNTALLMGTALAIGGWPQYSAYGDWSVAGFRHWSAALNATEAAAEFAGATAVRATNLVREYRFTSGDLYGDQTANNYDLSVGSGSPTYTADPAALGAPVPRPSALTVPTALGNPTARDTGLRVLAQSTQLGATGSTATMPMPAGYATGDLLVAVIAGRPTGTAATNDAISLNQSWTLRGSRHRREVGTADLTVEVWTKVATSSSETAPTVTVGSAFQTTSAGYVLQSFAVRGQHASTVFDVTDVASDAAAAATFTPTGLTTATNGALVLSVVASADDNALSATTPQGFRQIMGGAAFDDTAGADIAIGVATLVKGTAGAVTMPTWTETLVGNDAWAGLALAIRPASTLTTAQPTGLTVSPALGSPRAKAFARPSSLTAAPALGQPRISKNTARPSSLTRTPTLGSPTAHPGLAHAVAGALTATPTLGHPGTTPPNASGIPMPGAQPGWVQVLAEDFATPFAEGAVLSDGTFPAPYATTFGAYPDGWDDTSGNMNGSNSGYKPSEVLSVSGSKLVYRLHVPTTGPDAGRSLASVVVPKPGGEENRLYARVELLMRVPAGGDPGYKAALLTWPESEIWPGDGEIDFVEGPLHGNIGAFMHRQDGVNGADQDPFPTSVPFISTGLGDGWHHLALVWFENFCRVYLNGAIFGTSYSRVPNTPMRVALQLESDYEAYPANMPVSGAEQIVEFDWLVIYEPDGFAIPWADRPATAPALTEAFTGTSGAWPSPWVQTYMSSGGSATLAGDKGRITTGTAGGYNDVGYMVADVTTPSALVVDAQITFPVVDEYYPQILFHDVAGDAGDCYLVQFEPGGGAVVLYRSDDFVKTGVGWFDHTFVAASTLQVEILSEAGEIQVRVWPAGDARPSSPQLGTFDTTYTTGKVGLAVVGSGVGAVHYADFDQVTISALVASARPSSLTVAPALGQPAGKALARPSALSASPTLGTPTAVPGVRLATAGALAVSAALGTPTAAAGLAHAQPAALAVTPTLGSPTGQPGTGHAQPSALTVTVGAGSPTGAPGDRSAQPSALTVTPTVGQPAGQPGGRTGQAAALTVTPTLGQPAGHPGGRTAQPSALSAGPTLGQPAGHAGQADGQPSALTATPALGGPHAKAKATAAALTVTPTLGTPRASFDLTGQPGPLTVSLQVGNPSVGAGIAGGRPLEVNVSPTVGTPAGHPGPVAAQAAALTVTAALGQPSGVGVSHAQAHQVQVSAVAGSPTGRAVTWHAQPSALTATPTVGQPAASTGQSRATAAALTVAAALGQPAGHPGVWHAQAFSLTVTVDLGQPAIGLARARPAALVATPTLGAPTGVASIRTARAGPLSTTPILAGPRAVAKARAHTLAVTALVGQPTPIAKARPTPVTLVDIPRPPAGHPGSRSAQAYSLQIHPNVGNPAGRDPSNFVEGGYQTDVVLDDSVTTVTLDTSITTVELG